MENEDEAKEVPSCEKCGKIPESAICGCDDKVELVKPNTDHPGIYLLPLSLIVLLVVFGTISLYRSTSLFSTTEHWHNVTIMHCGTNEFPEWSSSRTYITVRFPDGIVVMKPWSHNPPACILIDKDSRWDLNVDVDNLGSGKFISGKMLQAGPPPPPMPFVEWHDKSTDSGAYVQFGPIRTGNPAGIPGYVQCDANGNCTDVQTKATPKVKKK